MTTSLAADAADPFTEAPRSRIFTESSFFTEQRAPELPPPAEVRALNVSSGNKRASLFNRPSPVSITSLGLFVKYGADVTVTEAKTQVYIRRELSGKVPVPEVFGWVRDGGQTFIYMSLVEGQTLQERFLGLSEDEAQAVCQELRGMVNTWRSIVQNEDDRYIGSLGKRELNDIFIRDRPKLKGAFLGVDAVQKFQDTCGIDIEDPWPISFTHNDLCPLNVLISRGPNPKIVAIIDWGQSGWYPAYWEYCKARKVGLTDENFDKQLQEFWHTTYLPLVIDPVDNESCFYPWLYFMLSSI